MKGFKDSNGKFRPTGKKNDGVLSNNFNNKESEITWKKMSIKTKKSIIETWYDKKKMQKEIDKNKELKKMGVTADDFISSIASDSWNDLDVKDRKQFETWLKIA